MPAERLVSTSVASRLILATFLLAAANRTAAGAAAEQRPLRGSGPVNVMYAGSLTALFEKKIGPAFATATGFEFQGEGKGSVAIANLIKGKVRTPDVFVSADPTVNVLLQGAANGDYVRWWTPFARTEMVIGWSPKSRFKEAFESAQSAFVRGEYLVAAERFLSAYEHKPYPAFLFNVAVSDPTRFCAPMCQGGAVKVSRSGVRPWGRTV